MLAHAGKQLRQQLRLSAEPAGSEKKQTLGMKMEELVTSAGKL